MPDIEEKRIECFIKKKFKFFIFRILEMKTYNPLCHSATRAMKFKYQHDIEITKSHLV